MARAFHSLWLCALLVSCGGSQDASPLPGRPAPADEDPVPAPAGAKDGPHISRSVGQEGGAVVFWPRVIPKSDDPAIAQLAGALQQRLYEVTKKVVPANVVDLRPEPERVCPKAGCAAITVGVLLTAQGGGCTAVALVSGKGQAPIKLIPWAGKVTLAQTEVPFRDFPENQVTIRDSVPCPDLMAKLADKEGQVRAAIKAALKE